MSVNKILLTLPVIMFLLVHQVFADSVTVTVPERVYVQGPVITLGDLADISGDDREMVNRLREVKLGSAPAPGRSMVFTPEVLGGWLASSGIDYSGVIWKIPANVSVTTSSQAVGNQNIIDTAAKFIAQRTGATDGSITITPLYRPQDVLAPPGKVDLTVDLPFGIHYNVPTTANVAITIDGQYFTKVSIPYDVKLYKEVLVTTRTIPQKEMITKDSLRLERMDVGRITSGYFTDIDKVAGLVSRRQLPQGTVVNEYMLEKASVIKHGSTVVIMARLGDLIVTTSGVALQDGSVGQSIRVQNTNSKKIITARVLDENSVLAATINRK